MNRKLLALLLVLGTTTSAQALPFAKGNAEAGKALFEKNNCNGCHAKMLGGDGSAVFTRAEHKVKTPAALSTQIRRCSSNLGLMLFEEDEENLAAYLNKTYYKFK